MDLRNHGFSDHHSTHNYSVMAEDVVRYADSQNINKFTILGHSMGGKTALTLACMFPSRIDGLIVIDAPPINAKGLSKTSAIMSTLQGLLDIRGMTRPQVMKMLYNAYEDKVIANLIGTNLEYDESNQTVYWKSNLHTIIENFDNVLSFEDCGEYLGEDAFILYGEKSPYKFNFNHYKKYIPNLLNESIYKVEGAGHWVHADKPVVTLNYLTDILDKMDRFIFRSEANMKIQKEKS